VDSGARTFRRYLAAQALCIAATFATTPVTWTTYLCQFMVGATAVACLMVTVRRSRLAGAAAWYCFGAGILSNATGTLVDGIGELVFQRASVPSVADLFWLGLYPGLIAGMAYLIRRRSPGPQWATLIDTVIITTGLALVSWEFLVRPEVMDAHLTTFGRAVLFAYPIGDIVVMGMMLRLLIGPGRRSPALLLMVGGLLAGFAANIGWTVVLQLGRTPGLVLHHFLDSGAMVGYTLVSAAALHASAADLARPAPRRSPGLSIPLLIGLGVATLAAPSLLALQSLRGTSANGLAIGTTSTVLFLLVVASLIQLLRQVQEQTRVMQEQTRVDELTGLPNRRAWAAELPIAMDRARRKQSLLTVAKLELDDFKGFAAAHGATAGDQLLKDAGEAWRSRLRLVDHLARYEREEFVLMLPDATDAQAALVIDRLRPVTPGEQTFSAGVATWDGLESGGELVGRAEYALVRAKVATNRTELANGTDGVAQERPRQVRGAEAAKTMGNTAGQASGTTSGRASGRASG
jgi:diguanylate cyclase (GGDEF)-like protein